MEEEEDFEIDDDEVVAEYEWTKEHAVHDLMWFATQMQQATSEFFAIVTARLAADSNFKVDQKDMHQQTAKDIESLPVFQEPEGTDG